jgi:hypothetical protein
MVTEYAQGLLDGCLLTKDIVEKELARRSPRKEMRERLAAEFGFIQEQILGDRISDLRRQLEML